MGLFTHKHSTRLADKSENGERLFDLISDVPSESFPAETGASLSDDILTRVGKNISETPSEPSGALDGMRRRMMGEPVEPQQTGSVLFAPEETHRQPAQPEEPQKKESTEKAVTEKAVTEKTLLEKCLPYIVDDEGKNVTIPSKPLYRLETVAEILKNDSTRTVKELAKKYDITFDDLGKGTKKAANTEKPAVSTEKQASPIQKAAKETVEKAPPTFRKDPPADTVEESRIYEERMEMPREPKREGVSLPDLSDIDNDFARRDVSPPSQQTATIRFTPVREEESGTERMRVSTQTRQMDLTGELGQLSIPQESAPDPHRLEESEFESFVPDARYLKKDQKQLIREVSLQKRTAFLQLTGAVLCTVALAVLYLPFLADFPIRSPRAAMIYCTAVVALETLMQLNLFSSFRQILRPRSSADIGAAFSAVMTLVLGGWSIRTGENQLPILLLGAIVLLFRAMGCFLHSSGLLCALKVDAVPRPKKAVALITDEATAFAMTKNSVEGDTMIAAPRPAERIDDLIKYGTYSTVLGKRLRIVHAVTVLLAVLTAVAAFSYFHTLTAGFYCAAVITSLGAMPTLFLTHTLPFYRAALKLSKKGAMLAGNAAADRLELANAVVLSGRDLFPDGTVTLHDLKVLSENNFDEIILRAASLTDAVNSPLTPIFQRIAGTNSDYRIPDSDTVKYEDNLGLSGWVSDELLFIGNRSLMTAHGIALPDFEVDRKILHSGYFPVYLASGGKACALLSVEYNVRPDIVRELRQLTALGVTLLIENSDPNLSRQMICDYMGLYEDSVQVMSNAGVHMYRNAVPEVEHCSAPATFRGTSIALATILNTAARVKRSNTLLTVLYVLAVCVGAVLFAYFSFTGSQTLPAGSTVLLYCLGTTALSYIISLFTKP